uniref:Integrin beta n=1 Tax=Suberites domuncula TaxID=55567 RepID=O97343_SUBDO|nr:integrin beta subunit [Suberites domuncula]
MLLQPSIRPAPMGGSSNTASPPLEGNTQISPSIVRVDIRPGQPVNFPITVRPARNFPGDIYLLMDLSFSMADDLQNLKNLGSRLATEISGISENFQVGFGSFVDKRLPPFVSLDPVRQNNPCPGTDPPCVSTYSFRHSVKLTDNDVFFNQQVQDQMISGNQDSPEGGFDGFLQPIVCTNLIGWRDVSRKLLLYITDAGFHIAGDGKVAGVILPNDGTCRTSGTTAPQDYDDWITYDYPSIGQIAQALRENDIIPIFAAEARALPVYEALVREIGEGAFSGTLARDSGNIVDLVRESYNNVSQRIIFGPERVPGVSVDIQPTNCPGEIVDGVCTGVQIENNATFQVSVTLQECTPENSGNIVTVPIRVLGFGSFDIELNAICSCPCDGTVTNNSALCTGNGTLRCGQCDCNPGRFGDMCQCDATGQGGMQQMCPLGPTELQCTSTDRGTCVCGECQCRRDSAGNPIYFGPACECDRSSCPSFNGELCAGRGACTCDGCRCNLEPNTQQPYFGTACECSPDTNCVDPNNSTDICNGRGTCGCSGRCDCQFPYRGDFCEVCSGDESCFDLTCDSNAECANCAVDILDLFPMSTNLTFFTNETLNSLPNGTSLTYDALSNTFRLRLPTGECPETCSPVVIINGTDDVDYMIQDEMSIRCELVRGCTYRYYVAVNEDTLDLTDVHVEFRRFCPEPVIQTPAWIIAIAIIVALLILGVIALLLLKLFLFIIDVIEVKKFEKELAKTKYPKHQNPLYRSAAKDYQNPIYGQ